MTSRKPISGIRRTAASIALVALTACGSGLEVKRADVNNDGREDLIMIAGGNKHTYLRTLDGRLIHSTRYTSEVNKPRINYGRLQQ